MRVVVQRVSRAAVRVDGEIRGRSERGYLCLVGLARGDTEVEMSWMARKIPALRLFDDEEGRLNLCLGEVHGRVLAVSQFTLLGAARKGRRPSWEAAMPPSEAGIAFQRFVDLLAAEVGSVETGVFGARMEVELINDCPVTLVLDRLPAPG